MTTFAAFPQNDYPHNAAEVGAALGGLIRRDSAGLPVPGVLGRTDNLIKAVSASWQVEVGRFVYVDRDGAAVNFSGVSEPEQLDILPAAGNIPAGQARIDRVVWDTETSQLGVVTGTPAASPAPPSTGGMAPLGRVRVNAGDGMVIASRVTVDAATTGLAAEPRVAQGIIAPRNVASEGYVDIAVSFPAGLFTEVPVILPGVVTSSSVRSVRALALNPTLTGFTMRLDSSSSMTRRFGAHWRAEQR